MSRLAPLKEVLAALGKHGLQTAEVYAKSGRSRHLEVSVRGEVITFNEEAGWAVRAGDERCSFFAAAAGEPRADHPWPEPDGLPLELPPARTPAAWSEPADLDQPLVGEREGLALLDGLRRDVEGELAGSRLLAARLTDGASESRLASSRGVEASWRSRVATLELEAAGPSGALASLVVVAGSARGLEPRAAARRMVDVLTVAAGAAPERDRGEMLLAPPVAARLLAGLLPLLVGEEAEARCRPFADPLGRLAGDGWTVVDDGRLAGGALAAPVDGEGVPTREVTLVDGGRLTQPLVPWWRAAKASEAAGCVRRASWRDMPRPGPSHLYIRPDPGVAVAPLASGLARGYYLIDAPAPGRFDFAGDRFSLPVRGFRMASGRVRAPVAGARLGGSISGLLRGLKARGRDLAFLPLEGAMIGAPTLLFTGMEIAGEER